MDSGEGVDVIGSCFLSKAPVQLLVLVGERLREVKLLALLLQLTV